LEAVSVEFPEQAKPRQTAAVRRYLVFIGLFHLWAYHTQMEIPSPPLDLGDGRG